jgi:hypothetical protein
MDTNADMDDINALIWRKVIQNKARELITIIKLLYPHIIIPPPYLESLPATIQLTYAASTPIRSPASLVIRPLPHENRCIARCWSRLNAAGTQCSRSGTGTPVLCAQHTKSAPHGLFTDPVTPRQFANFAKYASP